MSSWLDGRCSHLRQSAREAPSDLGLNIGAPPTGFSTGSRKLEDRHSVNTGESSWVGLSPECLGGVGIVTQGGVTRVWSCVHELYPCESSFVVRWKPDLHVVVRPVPMDHGSRSRSGDDTTK